MKVAFITNLPSHFHTPLFETFAKHYDTDFIFFSEGTEGWIAKKNVLKIGNYKGEFVHGLRLTSRTRLNYSLVGKLLQGKYDILIQAISGRFELLATFIFAKLARKRFILWANLWFHPKTLFHRMTFPVTLYIYRHADAIVAYGYHVRDYLVSLGVDEERIFYSWNVIDNDAFNKPASAQAAEKIRARYHLEGRHPLLFVGRFVQEKGLRYLLEAFKNVPRELCASLLLIGGGEEKELLKAFISEHALQHVHIIDHVPNEELAEYYAIADIFILPSITTATFKEPWGIVINEAMNQGCPVIATNAVGAAMGGLVQEGRNGMVVPEKDPDALREAIVRLLSDPKALREMKDFTKQEIKEWDHQKSFAGFQQAINFVVDGSKNRGK